MTQPLSPIARFTMDAARNAYWSQTVQPDRDADADLIIATSAAAIRALVEQALPEEPEPLRIEFDWNAEWMFSAAHRLWRERQRIRTALLGVADEMEGAHENS